jgi:hypothetical protein
MQAVPDMIVTNAAAWRGVLTGPGDLRRRPAPGKWSAVEYGCHGYNRPDGALARLEPGPLRQAGVRPRSPRCAGSTLTRLCAAITR